MNKVHAAGIALLLGAAAVFGMVAATRTAGLGRAASSSASAQTRKTSAALAWRAHRLDRIEAALRRSLRSRPPKLPPVPAVHHPTAAPLSVASAPVAAAPPRVVYQRPPPIVVVKHHAHGDESESGEGGGDD